MVKHVVKCLYCGESFDTNAEEAVMEGRRYLHKKCADEKKESEVYISDLHNYISHIYGTMYSKARIDKQIKEMIADGKTAKNINLALKYWYGVKKGDVSKSQGSIRIVNYIYQDAIDYYRVQESNKHKNKNVKIVQETEEVKVAPKPIGKPKRFKLFDLK